MADPLNIDSIISRLLEGMIHFVNYENFFSMHHHHFELELCFD